MGILGRKKTTKKDDAATKKPTAVKKAATKDVKKADAKEEKKAPTAKRAIEGKDVVAYEVVREPVFTEKADGEQTKNKYTFYVDRSANKIQIAQAIKALYGVEPVAVRVLNVKGKKVRFGRTIGKRKDRKKAVVTLKTGDTIAVME